MSESTKQGCCSPSRGGRELAHSDSILPTFNTEGMALIPAQTFLMGSDSHHVFHADNEGPVREVEVNEFWIDRTTVTNRQFVEFVAATGYETESESFGWSYVFDGLVSEEVLAKHTRGRLQSPNWWLAIDGADWAHPFGPDSDVNEIQDHPVVHVSFNDANAFARWSGKRLPTEAEWECAARGGLEQKTYPWGNDFFEGAVAGANIWEGEFPRFNTLADGFLATAPAESFRVNGYGLYNLVGNVWEWTSSTWDGQQVLKGGSYLCHDSYCNRYRVSARIKNTPDSALSHTGFRLVTDSKEN